MPKKKKRYTETINIAIESEIKAKAEEKAWAEETTLSQIIRGLLKCWLGK